MERVRNGSELRIVNEVKDPHKLSPFYNGSIMTVHVWRTDPTRVHRNACASLMSWSNVCLLGEYYLHVFMIFSSFAGVQGIIASLGTTPNVSK